MGVHAYVWVRETALVVKELGFGQVKFEMSIVYTMEKLSRHLDMSLEFREVQAGGTNIGVICIQMACPRVGWKQRSLIMPQ
jgi:hypothetical protein